LLDHIIKRKWISDFYTNIISFFILSRGESNKISPLEKALHRMKISLRFTIKIDASGTWARKADAGDAEQVKTDEK
jgi:hypothetical protein